MIAFVIQFLCFDRKSMFVNQCSQPTDNNLKYVVIDVEKEQKEIRKLRKKMDGENDIVVDLFPGATNTNLLKETLADILPCTSYVLETIKGTPDQFKADFYINCSSGS